MAEATDVGAITVLIVDDHRMFAEALRVALDMEDGIRVAGVATGSDDPGAAAGEHRARVTLVDLDIPGRDAIDTIRSIGRAAPDTAILALVTEQSDLMVARAVEAGAAGHLSKYEPVATVGEIVRRAASGEDLLGPRERRRLLGRLRHRRAEQATAQQRADRLTPRELQVLQLMADGASPQQIVKLLRMRPATLRTHVQNVIMKLGVHSKTEALAFAIRHGKVSARA
jgi:DNA-binding NarL/FixJ family response regulator